MDKFTNILNEKLKINKNTVKRSILFTDIVGSAKLWVSNPDEMIKALEKQSDLFYKLVEKTDGIIKKTIGDAYMISFKEIEESIEFAIELQKNIKETPIKIGKNNIQIRIGICYGNLHKSVNKIQNYELVDYFGNVVNTAARIEGKVCKPGNVAFTSFINDIDVKDMLKDYDVDCIKFKNDGDEVKRSSRLLTDVHRYYYKDVKELKGLDEVTVYHIKL